MVASSPFDEIAQGLYWDKQWSQAVKEYTKEVSIVTCYSCTF